MASIKVKLNSFDIDEAIKELEIYKQKIQIAAKEIAKRLAELGYEVAYSIINNNIFDDETLSQSLQVKAENENKYILLSNSKEILFFEFGAGAKYGYGHPLNADFGMGPGTYPGKGHWDDPNGWWYPTDNPSLIKHVDKSGQGWAHTYGNAPYMPFYKASKEIKANLQRIAEEVFKSV